MHRRDKNSRDAARDDDLALESDATGASRWVQGAHARDENLAAEWDMRCVTRTIARSSSPDQRILPDGYVH